MSSLYEYQKSILFCILEQRAFLEKLTKEDYSHIKVILKSINRKDLE